MYYLKFVHSDSQLLKKKILEGTTTLKSLIVFHDCKTSIKNWKG